MKICLYTSTYLPKVGGIENYIQYLAKHLTLLGQEVTVLNATKRPFPDPTEQFDLNHKVVNIPRPSSGSFGVLKGLAKVRDAVEAGGYDVIHCQKVYPAGYVAWALQERTGHPYLLSAHGKEMFRKGGLFKPNFAQRMRHAYDRAYRALAGSKATRDDLIASGCPPEKVALLPYGVEVDTFRNDGARPDIDSDYIFSVGRQRRHKGYDILIDAFGIVAQRHRDIKLVLAGDGPEQPALREQAASLGIADRILFAGLVSDAEKARWMHHCRLFVCPSRVEIFGIVNIEALAAGRPVVASGIDGIPELVADGKSGLLVPPEDPPAMAAAIGRILDDAGLEARLAAGARQDAAQYDWPVIAQRTIGLYEEAIENARISA